MFLNRFLSRLFGNWDTLESGLADNPMVYEREVNTQKIAVGNVSTPEFQAYSLLIIQKTPINRTQSKLAKMQKYFSLLYI